MAKSLRSSSRKGNRSRLRSKVFAHVEHERNERLSAKLLELASKPKPDRVQRVQPDRTEQPQKKDDASIAEGGDEAMDLDHKPKGAVKRRPVKASKIRKKKSASIVFPVVGRKGRRR